MVGDGDVLSAVIGDVLDALVEMNAQLTHACLHQHKFHIKVEIITDI